MGLLTFWRVSTCFEETEVVNPGLILINMIRLSDLNDREWHDRSIREQYKGAVLKSMVRNNTDLKKSATGDANRRL